MAFVKLDTRILDSTLWVERECRELFITALLMAEPIEFLKPVKALELEEIKESGFEVPPGWYGFVGAAGPGIVRRCGMELSAGMEGLRSLGSPDLMSRSRDFEGRRMVRVDGGFVILNYMKYRDRDTGAAERQKRYRERQKRLETEKRVMRDVDNVTRDSLLEEVELDVKSSEKEKTLPRSSNSASAVPPIPLGPVLEKRPSLETVVTPPGTAVVPRVPVPTIATGSSAMDVSVALLRYAEQMQLRGNAATWATKLPGLSQRFYEALSEVEPADRGATEERQLQELRRRVLEARQDPETAVRDVWGPEFADAPPELRRALERGLAVPAASPGTPRGAVNHPKTSPRGTRFDPKGGLPEEWRLWTRQHRPDLQPQATFDAFSDFWVARAGSIGVKLDWFATWRNWCRREKPGGLVVGAAGVSRQAQLEARNAAASRQFLEQSK